ncbi:adenosylmethionine--8-amino-7-oxononanoate transaminase [Yinghuangia sp. ASG 101]|uniref:adenosylmethionine--8-amino-7-oxononanoate transaminase n=1 Tax=Yinghuangia sp. ASG 101 TaxID=2896848 RepID=UPI001E35EC26|nr:adenosylmethionine--8-amino-7-oxononanoate transaminase [Yinghuangia sp. ASG 101]UGQ10267.1 adenosylmethionine--8-amino-7-oxononanoate transaminase [Yinghuangia sp. ASG 101]
MNTAEPHDRVPAGSTDSGGGRRVDGDELVAYDRRHIWHPYAGALGDAPLFPVVSAAGVRLRLADGRELIDGMASWWSAIHGYNHPSLNAAARRQLDAMAHVMFGGLTHPPAVELARRLVDLTPKPLQRVFPADSGSVAVEVALKMALQYQRARGRDSRTRMLTVRGGYHGDTFAAMAICDPDGGMHSLWSGALPEQLFAPTPPSGFDRPITEDDTAALAELLTKHQDEVAAVVLEPIVQGTGGMRFHAPAYLRRVRELCDEAGVLLIADEIATGFGRTGAMFACDHAGIAPDILCVGKALTGGYLTMAATLCTDEIAETISRAHGAFMHGPTFMANPLAAAVAVASIDLLVSGPWQERVAALESGLRTGLAPARELPQVADVRVLGGIGVIELHEPVDMARVQPAFVERGVWIRPFGKLVYTMPPYVMGGADLAEVTGAMVDVVGTVHPAPGR